MKSTSSGNGLRNVRAIASTPRSATSRRRISASIISLKTLSRPSKSSRASRSSNAPSPIWRLSCGLLHHLADETVGVELTQRAVEVVRAADRSARLHAREARDRRRREHAHFVLVHAHERVEEHLRELLVGDLAHRAALIHRGAQLVEVCLRVGVELGLAFGVHAGREHREVDLEHRLEHAVVARVLHERRAERGLERGAILERHVLDRAHRVEVLGHAHGQARGAQLVHEPLQHVEHVRLGRQHAGHVTAPLPHRVIELVPLHALLLDDRWARRRPAPCAPWRCRSGT